MAKNCGLKKQIRQVNPKMGFIGGPNMALENLEFKDQFGLKLERNGREERRGEEEEEEEKMEEPRSSQQGMETEFMYGFYEIMYEFPCFDGYPLAQI